MSRESKAFREALNEVRGKYQRVYTSVGRKGRRVKLYGVQTKYFPMLERVAKHYGAVLTEQMNGDFLMNGVPSFVAWFPLQDGIVPAVKPLKQAKPSRLTKPAIEEHTANTVERLVNLLAELQRKKHCGSWSTCSGPHGHASVILFDYSGNIIAEIRNKV